MNCYRRKIALESKCLKNLALFILIHLNVDFMLLSIFLINKSLLNQQIFQQILSLLIY